MDIADLLTYIKTFKEMTECTVFRAVGVTYIGTGFSGCIIFYKNCWNVHKVIGDVFVRLYRNILRFISVTNQRNLIKRCIFARTCVSHLILNEVGHGLVKSVKCT
jgi:hypothetical protein